MFDEDPICESCGNMVALREGTEHTGYCDPCAQDALSKAIAILQTLYDDHQREAQKRQSVCCCRECAAFRKVKP